MSDKVDLAKLLGHQPTVRLLVTAIRHHSKACEAPPRKVMVDAETFKTLASELRVLDDVRVSPDGSMYIAGIPLEHHVRQGSPALIVDALGMTHEV